MVDQKRLILAIAISIMILFVFEIFWNQPIREAERARQAEIAALEEAERAAEAERQARAAPGGLEAQGEGARGSTTPADLRVRIDSPGLVGSINLTGARFDDLSLRNFRETVEADSPLVRLLMGRDTPTPYWVQFGWTAEGSVRVPDVNTRWQTSATVLTAGRPVTLSWDNGEGLLFELVIRVDEHFLFTVEQRVTSSTAEPVTLRPWGRVRREHTPQTAGNWLLHEGLVGVFGGRLTEQTYTAARDEAAKGNSISFRHEGRGGWGGFTDKYWLTALLPDQTRNAEFSFRVLQEGGQNRFQIDFLGDAKEVRTGLAEVTRSHLFAGAKLVSLLDRYEATLGVEGLDKAIDWGWFYFLTRPFFAALHWLSELTGNYGVAILIFTLFLKILFFPLANKSYKAMGKMKLLAPQMQELKDKFKDDPQKMQQEMMALYKREKVNPVSGCLPIIIQIPVFFALYKVLFVTIEMRHAPFFGWIRDLSAQDPTNIFTLFGLIPWEPTVVPIIGPFLHLGIWPLLMGVTMYAQQKLNPAPPDPVQAKVFQFMPIVFTFMLGTFPVGLVIYWTWNNLLSIAQQWLMMRRVAQSPQMAKT
ncbi:membrane protein insertase YidC [Elioraea tepida]|jgi:YidC/Oxa1 family membrane protein insertase|uniref:Membrane protein insertase YidC n=1 Tax=Elioraea tepida TaxID=2843330 RepID=A0A975U103_9PROT|nr:membrane protein insertase YidC [Elioraea tepida]QXM24365.1 membrane protein insertase YidC [Elioraea tepida]